MKKKRKLPLQLVLWPLHYSILKPSCVSQPDSKGIAYIRPLKIILNIVIEIKKETQNQKKFLLISGHRTHAKNLILLNSYDWFTMIINFVRVVI